jgi:8-oxo-dGTP diphosphatase
MRKAVLVFLQREGQLLLLDTDYGHKRVWNGVSGYIDGDETPEQAVVREVKEEIGVDIDEQDLTQKGENEFFTIFTTTSWLGEPKPMEEDIKELKLFKIDELPWGQMHEGNKEWLYPMLST